MAFFPANGLKNMHIYLYVHICRYVHIVISILMWICVQKDPARLKRPQRSHNVSQGAVIATADSYLSLQVICSHNTEKLRKTYDIFEQLKTWMIFEHVWSLLQFSKTKRTKFLPMSCTDVFWAEAKWARMICTNCGSGKRRRGKKENVRALKNFLHRLHLKKTRPAPLFCACAKDTCCKGPPQPQLTGVQAHFCRSRNL